MAAALELDVQQLPQDHLLLVAHSIIVMIKAIVTRDLAMLGLRWRPGRPGWAFSYSLRRAGFGDVKPGALLEPPNNDQLTGLAMGGHDQVPCCPWWQLRCSLLAAGLRSSRAVAGSSAEVTGTGALKVVYLARVKIDQS